jgi:hypothetical protein
MPRWIIPFVLPIAAAVALRLCLFHPPPAPPPPIARANFHPVLYAEAALRSLEPRSTTRPSKLWATDLPAYESQNGGAFVVGRSPRPCLSEAEAIAAARADTVQTIDALAHSYSPWLRAHLAADVRAGQFEMDRQTQRFDRPYGTVWTASVLMNVFDDFIRRDLAIHQWNMYEHESALRLVRIAATVVFIAGWLFFAIFNSLTKGYLTRPLWLTAMAINAAALVLLV